MRVFCLAVSLLVVGLVFPACETVDHRGYRVTVESPPAPPPRTVVVHEHHGPPPHAPAHGYRHKHRDRNRDVELVYDANVGCYAVAGYRDYYFSDGVYFRFAGDGWQISASIGDSARWDYCADSRVPQGLHGKYKADHRGNGKGKAKDKGKGKTKFSSAAQWGKFGI